MHVIVSALPKPTAGERVVEVVERKGLGHPDSLCDALAEAFSLALCRHYRERFGAVLHHNVDKLLLAAGLTRPAFGGGEVIEPIRLYLAGRATSEVDGERVPVEAIADRAVRDWCARNLHALDPGRHLDIAVLARPSSPALVDLFRRRPETGAPLANDTSIGVGYAPLTALERAVLAVERALNNAAVRRTHPAIGEDVKVMAVRRGEACDVTIAAATVDRHLAGKAAYAETLETVAAIARKAVLGVGVEGARIAVNAADDPAAGSFYLTVTGTSAESGDDGEAGRGNRANGLITPGRPMSIEAAAGKNPISHIGKLYNLAAGRIAAALVAEIEPVAAAECLLVSRIGRPIDEPQLAEAAIATADGGPPERLSAEIEAIVRRELAALRALSDALVDGRITLDTPPDRPSAVSRAEPWTTRADG